MKKSVIAVVFIIFAAFVISGCASKEGTASSEPGKESHTLTIATGDFYEFCDKWEVGDNVKFSFTSSKPVLFNVHYHTQNEKNYPIKEILVDEFSGSFIVQTKDVHCGMWENKNDSYVKLTYEVEVVKE